MSWNSKAMSSYDHGWSDYVKGLKQALVDMEKDITEA